MGRHLRDFSVSKVLGGPVEHPLLGGVGNSVHAGAGLCNWMLSVGGLNPLVDWTSALKP